MNEFSPLVTREIERLRHEEAAERAGQKRPVTAGMMPRLAVAAALAAVSWPLALMWPMHPAGVTRVPPLLLVAALVSTVYAGGRAGAVTFLVGLLPAARQIYVEAPIGGWAWLLANLGLGIFLVVVISRLRAYRDPNSARPPPGLRHPRRPKPQRWCGGSPPASRRRLDSPRFAPHAGHCKPARRCELPVGNYLDLPAGDVSSALPAQY